MINPIAAINYNGSSDTIAMIDSLVKSGEEFDVIIVDNQSPKEEELQTILKAVNNKYSTHEERLLYTSNRTGEGYILRISDNQVVTLIQGNDNYGFAIGTNIGLQYAIDTYPEAEYLTILNNDTEVTEGFLSKVINGIKDHDLAAAMGTILYYGYDKPYIWSVGGPIDYKKGQGVHLRKDTVFNPDEIEADFIERKFISGCFTVFKRQPLIEIGLLDEDYFFAGEEYQYSVDLTKKYKIGWIPSSIIFHKSVMGVGNGSSHKISDLKWQYNAYMVKIVFINKNKGLLYRSLWHTVFKVYISTKLKKKYLSIPEYGEKCYKLLKNELFKNINARKFVKKDFQEFSTLLES